MKATLCIIWLSAVCATSLHAQVCSGGADGGMDATGNQCNDTAAVAPHAGAPAGASPQTPAATSTFNRSTAAAADTRPTATKPARPTVSNVSTVSVRETSRLAKPSTSAAPLY